MWVWIFLHTRSRLFYLGFNAFKWSLQEQSFTTFLPFNPFYNFQQLLSFKTGLIWRNNLVFFFWIVQLLAFFCLFRFSLFVWELHMLFLIVILLIIRFEKEIHFFEQHVSFSILHIGVHWDRVRGTMSFLLILLQFEILLFFSFFRSRSPYWSIFKSSTHLHPSDRWVRPSAKDRAWLLHVTLEWLVFLISGQQSSRWISTVEGGSSFSRSGESSRLGLFFHNLPLYDLNISHRQTASIICSFWYRL